MNEIQTTALIEINAIGQPYPLGASLTKEGCNFAVYAPDAKAVILCFFNSDTEEAISEHPLPEKTGNRCRKSFEQPFAGGRAFFLEQPLPENAATAARRLLRRVVYWEL